MEQQPDPTRPASGADDPPIKSEAASSESGDLQSRSDSRADASTDADTDAELELAEPHPLNDRYGYRARPTESMSDTRGGDADTDATTKAPPDEAVSADDGADGADVDRMAHGAAGPNPVARVIAVLERDAYRLGPAASPLRNILRVLSVFGNTDYLALWSGTLMSNMGTWVYNVALQWLIWETTKSPQWLGYCAMAQTLSVACSTPFGGVIADRFDARKVLSVVILVMMSLCLGMALVTWYSGEVGVPPVVFLVASIVTGLCTGVTLPATQTLVPRVVGQESISHAVALNAMQFNTSRAIGPAIGGWLLSVAGAPVSFLINGFSYVFQLLAIHRLRKRKDLGAQRFARGNPFLSLVGAARYMLGRRELVLTEGLAISAGFGLAPVLNMLSAYVAECHGGGEAQFAILLSMFGLGAIIGVPIIAAQSKGQPSPWQALPLKFTFGFCNIALAVPAPFWVAQALVFVSGFCFIGGGNRIMAYVVASTPMEFRGRVVSFHFLLFMAALSLGSFIAGQVAQVAGMRMVMVGMGLFMVCAVTLLAWIKRRIGNAPVEPTSTRKAVSNVINRD